MTETLTLEIGEGGGKTLDVQMNYLVWKTLEYIMAGMGMQGAIKVALGDSGLERLAEEVVQQYHDRDWPLPEVFEIVGASIEVEGKVKLGFSAGIEEVVKARWS